MEVDFAIADHKKIQMIIEVKSNDENLSKSLLFFKEKLKVPLAFQVVRKNGACTQKAPETYVIGVDRFLSMLP
jgi:hypothetical protein